MQILLLILIIFIGVISYKATTTTKIKNKDIALAAILIVLTQVLNLLSITLPVFGIPGVKIGFTGIPLIIAGMVLNPFFAFLTAITNDLVGLVVTPTAFPFLGFTLNTVLTVMLSNLIYRKRKSILNKNYLKIVSLLFLISMLVTISLTDVITVSSEEFIITNSIKIALVALLGLIIILSLTLKQHIKKKYSNNLEIFNISVVISVVINIVIYMALTPLWLNYMYGIPIFISQFIRIVKAIFMIPLFSLIIYYLIKNIKIIKD